MAELNDIGTENGEMWKQVANVRLKAQCYWRLEVCESGFVFVANRGLTPILFREKEEQILIRSTKLMINIKPSH